MAKALAHKAGEPTPQVLSNAQRSYDALMTDTLVVPSMRRRGDFPVGQGNKYDVFTSD
nr:packaged DNA stabilization gp4 family protein [Escherichia coli]